RRRHTRFSRDWSSDVCSSDLVHLAGEYAHGRSAVPEKWLDPHRYGYDPSIEIYDQHALRADRWAPLTLCAIGWLCMADTDAGARSEECRVGKESRTRWGRR